MAPQEPQEEFGMVNFPYKEYRGIILRGKEWGMKVLTYRHCDMSHLGQSLATCSIKNKDICGQ